METKFMNLAVPGLATIAIGFITAGFNVIFASTTTFELVKGGLLVAIGFALLYLDSKVLKAQLGKIEFALEALAGFIIAAGIFCIIAGAVIGVYTPIGVICIGMGAIVMIIGIGCYFSKEWD